MTLLKDLLTLNESAQLKPITFYFHAKDHIKYDNLYDYAKKHKFDLDEDEIGQYVYDATQIDERMDLVFDPSTNKLSIKSGANSNIKPVPKDKLSLMPTKYIDLVFSDNHLDSERLAEDNDFKDDDEAETYIELLRKNKFLKYGEQLTFRIEFATGKVDLV